MGILLRIPQIKTDIFRKYPINRNISSQPPSPANPPLTAQMRPQPFFTSQQRRSDISAGKARTRNFSHAMKRVAGTCPRDRKSEIVFSFARPIVIGGGEGSARQRGGETFIIAHRWPKRGIDNFALRNRSFFFFSFLYPALYLYLPKGKKKAAELFHVSQYRYNNRENFVVEQSPRDLFIRARFFPQSGRGEINKRASS